MPERYPDDATLLNLTQDTQTGVEYVPTGKSPYYLEFRRLIQRLLLASQRANDLRVYQDGDLSIGIRPGKCHVNGSALDFAGVTGLAVPPGVTTSYWLDDAGVVQSAPTGFPSDRGRAIPLAAVQADTSAINSITDHRGEAILYLPTLNSLGMTHGVQANQPGAVTASTTGLLAGAVPFDGVVTDIVLSLGGNIVSDTPADGITGVAKVNGVPLAVTDPAISDADGPGFASTAQGAGTSAVVKSDGTEQVTRGDMLTADLVRSVSGVVSSEATDAVVMVVIRPV
jgi:hypothetical protein